MTYQETVTWMFNQLPMYQMQGAKALKHKLDNILLLSARLGQPHQQFKCIHVAGTNGKGSSSHMLASILQEEGYKVGLYTSPHLRDFRERIKVNGSEVPESFVVDFINEHKSFLSKESLSFFEMTVGMAFAYFAYAKVDIAIVEVGLGGRLDSTNIITPEVSLITNIGWDHTDILGSTLAHIAYEKAGIIKYKVPVVISEYQRETAEVFMTVAKEREAPIVFASQIVDEVFTSDLKGFYQEQNKKGVLATLKCLEGFNISFEAIQQGFLNTVKNTGLLGRWQQLNEIPKVICDTAHNLDGLTYVMRQLTNEVYDQLYMVIGFVKDKNIDEILPLFPKNAHYFFCKPSIERGLSAELLRDKAALFGLHGEVCNSVSVGYEKALEKALPGDLVYIGGSTFVVAEIV